MARMAHSYLVSEPNLLRKDARPVFRGRKDRRPRTRRKSSLHGELCEEKQETLGESK